MDPAFCREESAHGERRLVVDGMAQDLGTCMAREALPSEIGACWAGSALPTPA